MGWRIPPNLARSGGSGNDACPETGRLDAQRYMRRVQLFAIAESSWCPRDWREGLTDFLQWSSDHRRVYDPCVPLLAGALRAVDSRRVVDLDARGSGPWLRMLPALASRGLEPSVLLTDRTPNLRAFARAELASDGAIRGDMRTVDARCVQPELAGTRTMFSGFHRFAPPDARAVLADAARRGMPIAVVESTRRSWPALLAALLVPLRVLSHTPMIRPFRWNRLFWTYLLPAIPVIACWDGIVSCLRSYSTDELWALTRDIDIPDNWSWHVAEVGSEELVPLTLLIGTPGQNTASA